MSFNTLERKIGNTLSGFPVVKGFLKKVYFYLISLTKKNQSKIIKINQQIVLETPYDWAGIKNDDDRENMFGYFDINPWSKDSMYYLNNYFNPSGTIEVVLFNKRDSKSISIAHSKAINSQHCALAQWAGNEKIILNDIENNKVISCLYNIDGGLVSKSNYPVQSVSNDYKLFSSIDYSYLQSIGSDYGYESNLIQNRNDSNDLDESLKVVDMLDDRVIFSISSEKLSKLCDIPKRHRDKEINHAKFSSTGNYLSFIFRWCEKSFRKSKLFILNLVSGVVNEVYDFEVVSHYCWVADHKLLIWGTRNSSSSFVLYDLQNSRAETNTNTLINRFGDGHPVSFSSKEVIADTYPNRSRMQTLYSLDYVNWDCEPLLQLYSPLKFINKNRVDLHPRVSPCKGYLSIDTSHDGCRRNLIIKVKDH